MTGGLIIPGVITIADVVLEDGFFRQYFDGKFDYLLGHPEQEKKSAWRNVFRNFAFNPSEKAMEIAQEQGYNEYLVTEPHVRDYCGTIAQAVKKDVALNSVEFKDKVRGLVHIYQTLFHRHCENNRLGIDMTFDEAAEDYIGRGFNTGLRSKLKERKISTSDILCAKTLADCCALSGDYEPFPESLGEEPLFDGKIEKFPTGVYRFDGKKYVAIEPARRSYLNGLRVA
jgi:hypothetical protein